MSMHDNKFIDLNQRLSREFSMNMHDNILDLVYNSSKKII